MYRFYGGGSEAEMTRRRSAIATQTPTMSHPQAMITSCDETVLPQTHEPNQEVPVLLSGTENICFGLKMIIQPSSILIDTAQIK